MTHDSRARGPAGNKSERAVGELREQRSSWGESGRPPSASASRRPEGTMPCQSTQLDDGQKSWPGVHSLDSRSVTKADGRSCRPSQYGLTCPPIPVFLIC